ncbi:hypothetical protein [Flavobacterium sp.]|uniref:hypothetical protein n=1 Tax=Flavobacterium sp. TaxID=239 RepID=UPI003F694F5E
MKSTLMIFPKLNNSIISKKLLFIPLGLIVSFCAPKKEITDNDKTAVEAKKINLSDSNCPEDGICSIEVIKNKSIVVKTDDFGSNYYLLEDNENTSVIYYKYDRNFEKDLQDAYYKEEIAFEVSNDVNQLNLTDEELQDTKMLYGRLCFCKGQTGFFKVTKGTLKYTKKGNEIAVDLDFENKKVPQIIKKIKATIMSCPKKG